MRRAIRTFALAVSFAIALPSMAQITVTSATPSSAAQGTTNLDVTISGNGFKRGANSAFHVHGTTNNGGVTVNSTSYASGSSLTANITIAADADISNYDVEVINNDGRTGVGSEAFAVVQGKTCSANVTTILYDSDNNNMPFQAQSDGKGPYTTYSLHKDSDASILQPDCSWTLDTTNSLSRGVAVTLAYPYSSGPPAPFTGPQTVKGVINSHCFKNSGNNGVDFGTMNSVGQQLICPINIAFYFNKVWYNIGINPYNWPGTTQTQVTCGGVVGGACNQWTVVPDPATAVLNSSTNQMSAIGELTLPSCVGCSDGTPLGLYYVSFNFLIHK